MNFFTNIFKPKHINIEKFDFSKIGTDIHSHLIPGIDDGSRSLDESVFLIKEMIRLGYKKIITTPHIQNDLYKNTPLNIKSGFDQLKNELAKREIDFEVEFAAEYLVDDGFMEKIEDGNLLTFGKNHVLIELPYLFEPPNLNSILFELQVRSYVVVLAHPERYVYWHKQVEKFQELYQRKIKLQLNINSLTGWYSLESKKMAELLIDRKLISFLGSDLHNQNYLNELRRSANLSYLHKVFNENIIQNNTL